MTSTELINKLIDISEKNIEHYGRLTGSIRELRDQTMSRINSIEKDIGINAATENTVHETVINTLRSLVNKSNEITQEINKSHSILITAYQDINEDLDNRGEGTIHHMVTEIRNKLKVAEKDRSKFYIKLTAMWGAIVLAAVYIKGALE